MNTRLMDSLQDVFALSNRHLQPLDDLVRKQLHTLYDLSECIGQLDYVINGASLRFHLQCLPDFGHIDVQEKLPGEGQHQQEGVLVIEDGVNPILMAQRECIPNDVHLQGLCVVSGANKCGKTTLLKQTALLQVMAQMGYPVPARRMQSAPRNMLAMRQGSDDDLESTLSSFAQEMQQLASILNGADVHSLILIDELARGTGIREGTALGISILESLLRLQCLAMVSTHLPALKKFARLHAGIQEMHFGCMIVQSSDDRTRAVVTPIHRASVATSEDDQNANNLGEGYGLALAKHLQLPRPLLKYAQEAHDQLMHLCESRRDPMREVRERRLWRLKYGT
jgi:DNA mismatch repair ATPase MutS